VVVMVMPVVMPMMVPVCAGDGRGGDRERDGRGKDVGEFLHFDLDGLDKQRSILRAAKSSGRQVAGGNDHRDRALVRALARKGCNHDRGNHDNDGTAGPAPARSRPAPIMTKAPKAFRKQARTAERAALQSDDAYVSGQMKTLAEAFRAQAEILKKKRKKKK
jgi:hypothetical protein